MHTVATQMKHDCFFLNIFCDFTFYLGISPFRLGNYSKKIKCLRKCYILLLHISFTFFCLNQFWHHNNHPTTSVKNLFKRIGTFIEIISFNGILLANSLYLRNWRKIFRFIDTELEVYFREKLKVNKSKKYFQLRFIFSLILLFIMVLTDIFPSIPLHGFYDLCVFFMLLHFLEFFRRRYVCLTNYLITRIKQRKSISDDYHLIEQIRGAVIMHRKMTDNMQEVNNIFGVFNFFLITYFLIKNIEWISLFLHFELDLLINHSRQYIVLFGFSSYFVVREFYKNQLFVIN